VSASGSCEFSFSEVYQRRLDETPAYLGHNAHDWQRDERQVGKPHDWQREERQVGKPAHYDVTDKIVE
jgi:hypothetical protein